MSAAQQGEESERTKQREQASGGRNPNPVYELFVLGELVASPQYGYRLHRIVNRILGPFHRLSWGTLYPLIRRLEQHGLITSEVEPPQNDATSEEFGQRGQPRRIYHLTEAGHARFFDLMLEPGEYSSNYPELFAVKLVRFVFLTSAQQRTVLQQYLDYLHILQDHYSTGAESVKHNPGITDQERPFILQAADYHLHTIDAELSWVEGRIAALTEDDNESESI